LKDLGKIRLITPAEVVGLNGAEHIESIVLNENEAERTIPRLFYSSFGLTPKLGLETGVRN
jgi:thioredoxin reductase (NADPH)